MRRTPLLAAGISVLVALVTLVALVVPRGYSQVPAGRPYQPGLHPNPIVTFTTDDAFGSVGYEAARESAGIELLGLSAGTGVREDVAIAESDVQEVELMGRKTDVLFFPTVRQRFRLEDGSLLTLYSFRNPRPGEVPEEILADVLNQHAFRPEDDPAKARFGPHAGPEELAIRGQAALLFESDPDTPVTLFWQQDGISHVATSPTLEPEDLFDVVEDFL
jgi:hypothetical protein